MKRPFIAAGLLFASLGLASTGCSQTGSKDTTTTAKSKYTDPSSWSDSDNGSTSRPPSGRLQGGWSSEARDIENHMGVGQ